MKILFIAPLPPPITGHSLASQVFLNELAGDHEVAVVNLSIGSTNDGRVTGKRVVEVMRLMRNIWRNKRGAHAIYLTISESVAGNLKDMLIYAICGRSLSKLHIHLHGGSIKRQLFDRYRVARWANAAFIGRLAGVIISGPAHGQVFAGMIDPQRIHIVPNFAEDILFRDEQEIFEKFSNMRPLRILYVSGMRQGKGYADLVEAFLGLPAAAREMLRLDFAGQFEAESDRAWFLHRIAGASGISYHGVVDEGRKQELFASAHIFCLPTCMFEGQPLSILEAYASGCVVITTGQSGIQDVFADAINGFEIQPGSAASLAAVLLTVLRDPSTLLQIALRNRRAAEKQYRVSRYNAALKAIIAGSGA